MLFSGIPEHVSGVVKLLEGPYSILLEGPYLILEPIDGIYERPSPQTTEMEHMRVKVAPEGKYYWDGIITPIPLEKIPEVEVSVVESATALVVEESPAVEEASEESSEESS